MHNTTSPASKAGIVLFAAFALQGCTGSLLPVGSSASTWASLQPAEVANPAETPTGPVTAGFQVLSYTAQPQPEIDRLINYYSMIYGVPERLVRRVIERESGYNAVARNGPYYGLMQIHPATAKSMGYQGSPAGLLDPDTNLKYAVKYLAGAYLVAGYNEARADILYQHGYYYDAKRLGLLEETGLR